MKTLKHYLSLMLLLFVGFACKKVTKPLKVGAPTIATDTNMLWKRSHGYGMEPKLNSMQHVLTNNVFGENGSEFIVYNHENGETLWKWQDYLRSGEIISTINTQFINDYLIALAGSNSYCFNATNGQTIWRHQFKGYSSEPNLYVDDSNYVYRSIYDSENYNYLRTPFDKCDWKLVRTEKIDPKYIQVSNCNMAIGYTSKKEKMLITAMYQLKKWNGSNHTEPRIVAYNMTQGIIEWDLNLAEKYVEFSSVNPVVYNGIYYSFAVYGTTWYLVAMNIETGQEVFNVVLPNFGTKMMVYNGKLIVTCNGRSPVWCLNMQTGAILWSIDLPYENYEQINFNFDNVCLFKNYLLSTQNNYFLGINLNTGKVICYKKYSENLQHDMGLVVNEQKRMYYTMNGKYFVAYKLPKEIWY